MDEEKTTSSPDTRKVAYEKVDYGQGSLLDNLLGTYRNFDTLMDNSSSIVNGLSYMLPVVGTARTFGDAFENFGAVDGSDGFDWDDAKAIGRGVGDLALGGLSLIPGVGWVVNTIGKGAKLLAKGAKAFGKSGKLSATMGKLAETGKMSESLKAGRAAKLEKEQAALGKLGKRPEVTLERQSIPRATYTENVTPAVTREVPIPTTLETPMQGGIANPRLRAHPGNAEPVSIPIQATRTEVVTPELRELVETNKAVRDAAKGNNKQYRGQVAAQQKWDQEAAPIQEAISRLQSNTRAEDVWDFLENLASFWQKGGDEGIGLLGRAGAAGSRALLADYLNAGRSDNSPEFYLEPSNWNFM